jgi:hypothetical protein
VQLTGGCRRGTGPVTIADEIQPTLRDGQHVSDNTPPFVVPTIRPEIPSTPAIGLLDRLFAGVQDSERADSLRFVRSGARGPT